MSDKTTLYGIKACDTMRKARAWLDAHGIAYDFHDYKTAGIDGDRLRAWVDKAGWQALVNRAGTTFRRLPETERADLDATKAIALMRALPSLIKRPVLECGDVLAVGFKPETYAALFAVPEA